MSSGVLADAKLLFRSRPRSTLRNQKLRHLSPAACENRPLRPRFPLLFRPPDREGSQSSDMICSLDDHLNLSGIQHGFRLILNSLLLLTALFCCFVPVLRSHPSWPGAGGIYPARPTPCPHRNQIATSTWHLRSNIMAAMPTDDLLGNLPFRRRGPQMPNSKLPELIQDRCCAPISSQTPCRFAGQ